jgi:hypothetical protein
MSAGDKAVKQDSLPFPSTPSGGYREEGIGSYCLMMISSAWSLEQRIALNICWLSGRRATGRIPRHSGCVVGNSSPILMAAAC